MKSHVIGFCLSLCACGGAESEGPLEVELGGLLVRVESNPAQLVISTPDGERSLLEELPGAGMAFRASEATYEMAYGSFKIEEPAPGEWQEVRRFSNARVEDEAVRFDLVGDEEALLGLARIEEAGDGHLLITLTGEPEWNRASLSLDCAADEHFFGFGGQTAAVDHRGATVPIWVQEDGLGKIDTDSYDDLFWFGKGRLHSTHTPMPMYVSSRGYALLLDSSYRSIFSMCSEEETTVRVEAWEGESRTHLFYGPTPKESIARMTAHVGRPTLPPAFTFAPWLDAAFGSENVRRIAQKLRDEDIPTSVLWAEDWLGATEEPTGYALEEDWELDRELYPDFEELAEDVRGLGYKFFAYHNSFLDPTTPVYEEATAGGFTIHDSDGEPFLFPSYLLRDMSLVDLTSPDAIDWAKGKFRGTLEYGTDGYMADFAEWLPVDAVLFAGDGESEHNLYPVRWARLNRELFDEMFDEDGVERLFFMRSAFLGSQPLASVIWAGDQQTNWGRDDGIASVIPIGIGLGVTGFPFFGHDIAGYQSVAIDPTSRELWFRWVTFGALSPVMRTHHGRFPRDNWNWEMDPESTAHMRRWTKLHSRLFPYLYALAAEAVASGAPMLRPLALEHPEFIPGWTKDDQFMLGDRIYVAPILVEGADERAIELPEGTYFPLEGGEAIASTGAAMNAEAGLTEIVAVVPAGTLLALLPEQVDTFVETTDAELVTLAQVGDDRELWVWPGAASELEEVSGLEYAWDAEGLELPVTAANYDGADVELTVDGQDMLIELEGPGVLDLNDGEATLTIEGGAADRVILVRVRGG